MVEHFPGDILNVFTGPCYDPSVLLTITLLPSPPPLNHDHIGSWQSTAHQAVYFVFACSRLCSSLKTGSPLCVGKSYSKRNHQGGECTSHTIITARRKVYRTLHVYDRSRYSLNVFVDNSLCWFDIKSRACHCQWDFLVLLDMKLNFSQNEKCDCKWRVSVTAVGRNPCRDDIWPWSLCFHFSMKLKAWPVYIFNGVMSLCAPLTVL